MKHVLFVLLDQYADWEVAPLASFINQTPGWSTRIVTPAAANVRSLGGFTTLPDGAIPTQIPEDCAGVVLIGGKSWRTEIAEMVEELTLDASRRGVVLGAICDATVFLGRLRLLNTVPHTSNMLMDLQNYAGANYIGSSFYRNENAVRSGNLVTANGTGAMDFAKEMIVALELLSEADAERWQRLFTLGCQQAQPEAFWWFSRMNGEKTS